MEGYSYCLSRRNKMFGMGRESRRKKRNQSVKWLDAAFSGRSRGLGIEMAKNFKDLSEREILAVAISLEEEDGRIYGEFAEGLRENYPTTAKMMDEMKGEESDHRARLIEMYRARFGDHIPFIRRQDVKGFVFRMPLWLVQPIGPEAVRKSIESMESETRRFYTLALEKVTDASTPERSISAMRSSAVAMCVRGLS